jgi:hypothetical protein
MLSRTSASKLILTLSPWKDLNEQGETHETVDDSAHNKVSCDMSYLDVHGDKSAGQPEQGMSDGARM